MTEPSTVFFPLRTSVELFVSPQSPDAVTRAKEAALLYERLIFEVGLLDVTIGDTGGSTWWTPPQRLTRDRIERSRIPIPTGAPFSIAIGKQASPGEPAQEMHAAVSGNVSVAFAAEWHSGILGDLVQFDPEWISTVELGGSDLPRSHPLGKQIANANFRDWTDKTLLRDRPTFERDFIYKSFNHDIVIAMDLNAAISITPLFDEMVDRHRLTPANVGDQALSVLVPNVGALPWEAVLEFRDHPGSQEAREMLRQFEQRAAQSEPRDALEYLRSISQEVTRAYALALEDQRPKLGEELAKEALKTGVSFVPAVGPAVEKVATVTQLLREGQRQRRSWTAAIMRLQDR